MNNILESINNGLWDNALEQFLIYSETNTLSEDAYILGATIMEHYGEYESMFNFVTEGLKLNPCNYELYLLLGNYYSISNKNQAFISYENALYYSKKTKNSDDICTIENLLKEVTEKNQISVRKVSFIILSYNTIDYTKLCIESIRNTCYKECYEIIVVDNASTDGSAEWLRKQSDIILIENTNNVGFPAGCNQGINAACKDNDIFLLNNDTILIPNSLFWLRIGLYKDDKTGATGAVTNYAVNEQTVQEQYNTPEEYIQFGLHLNVPSLNPYESKSFLVMYAMLIKRDTLNVVGLLDERFSPGNYEDNDYGIRIIENGYDCVLCHNSFIFHFGSKSFGKNTQQFKDISRINREKFKEKWGFYDDYYTHARNDVISMIDTPPYKNISVFEVGCGLGETLAKIKFYYPNAKVSGIEIVDTIASIGSKRFNIECGDIESTTLDTKYDIILFPDVLEHLKNPEKILSSMHTHLNENGRVIASIPNLMNAKVIYELLAGNFTYQDAGILDRTHLRFFTLNEIVRMFKSAGYEIIDIATTKSSLESTDAYSDFFDKLTSIEGVAQRELFDVYQFIVKASPSIKEQQL